MKTAKKIFKIVGIILGIIILALIGYIGVLQFIKTK